MDRNTVELAEPHGAVAEMSLETEANVASVTIAPDVRVLSDPNGREAECIAALRAQLMAQHLRDGRRSIAMCSPESGVGSTFVTANLAAAFALAGKKTLLIDANMRDPGVSSLLKVAKTQRGLMQYLADAKDDIDLPVEVDVIPGLSVIAAGHTADNPQELLAGTKFSNLINDAMRSYEITIVDTPAANIYPDALRIAMIVRYAMIIARKDFTKVSDIRALRDQLIEDRVKLVGAFLNDF